MLFSVNMLISSCLNSYGIAENISPNEKKSIEILVVISYIYIFVLL